MSLFKMLFKFFIKTACAFSLLFFSLFSYSQTAGDWNSFGMLYRWVDSVTITLTNNITEPFSPAAPFGEPGRSGDIIDGNGYSFLGNAAIPGPQLDSIFTISNGTYITFQNTSFEKFNNLNYGIFYISSGSTLSFSGAADIVFSSNSANNKSSSLYIEGSLISNSSVLHFLNNTSVIASPGAAYTSGGGAIRTVGSVSKSTISGSNILFDSNRAGAKGGAIYAESGSILTFGSMPAAMSGVIFRNNSAFNEVSALSQGGALYINNARINFVNASALFDSNSVLIEDNARTGGAVFLENQSVLHFDSSNVDFINNAATMTLSNNIAAGAIYAASDALISFNNSRVNFSNNVANVGMDREIAGAVILDGGFAIFNRSTVVFQNNGISPNPGYSQDTTILINNSASLSFLFSSARFADNTASDFAIGGGAAVKMQAANIYTASLNAQNSEIVFEGNGNSASSLFSGGAIYAGGTPGISSLTFLRSTVVFSNNAAYQGGAFYGANKSEFYFIDSIVKFSGNISQSRGLAFYLANGAKLYFSEGLVGFYNHGDVNLANNIWYAASGSQLSFAGVSVESINNKAAQGGFLDSDKENQDFVFRDVNFEGNTAQNLGGAVYFKNYNIVINGKYAQFSGNTALNGSGGAVHLERSSFSIRALSDIKFFNNEALLGAGITGNPGSGGGIFALNSFVGIYSASSVAVNTVFEQNKAELAGNVFYLSRSTLSFSNLNANFLNNSGIKGIGIYAFMSQINISGGFLSFSNNAAVEAGAGYLIDKSFLAIRNSSISASYNAADKGTLFYIDASTVLFDGIYRVDFFNNSALGTGASIFYALNSSFTINVLRGGNIYNNEAARFGGIAYFEFSSGSILGSNVADIIISNNSAGQSGGAVEIISSSISFGGRMIFEGNSAIGGNGGAIYIENQSKLTLNSNNGSIVFRNNYAGARLNDIYNHNTSTININGNVNDIVINSGIDGGGWIIKTGRGRLIVGADGGNFNGVFTQSAGSSVFTANSRMFLGNNFIENSLLSITAANPYSFDLIVNSGGIFEYYGASAQTFVIDPAKLRFGNTASNAKMKFGKDSSLSGNASFLLKDELANNALVNEIEFNNADIVFGVAAFNRRNTKYVFKNSTIDLTTDAVIANEVKTTSFSNIETGTSGTYLRFGIYVDASSKLFSDVLFANAGGGRIDLSSQSIVIYKEFPNLLPIVDTYIEFSTRVFRGAANLSFNPLTRWTTIITDEYQYIISVDVSSPWASIIFARKPEDSLNIINTEASSDKEYLLTIVPKLNPASDTYHILTDFGFSTDGRFYVSSAPNTPTTVGVEKLSGIFRNDDTQKGSFFKLNGNTQLIIDRLTITNGYASGRASTAPANGSVVNISNSQSSAILRDTIFASNTASQSGGVFYLNAGVLSIESVSRPISFSNNSAGSSGSGSGGVLYAENAKVFISTINKPIAFSSNSAAVNGGVFSLSNNASLEFFSKISSSILSFSKNSSSNLGGVFYAERGAAIFFNAGAAFEDNSAGQNGGVFALQNAKSSFSNAGTFSFKGNYSANGGVFYLNASSSYFSAFGASFENNAADGAGGAFYLENSFASFILKSANFISNFSQNGSGGAAAFLNSRFEFFGAASFFNNISSGDGGALHLENSNAVFSGTVSFENNRAQGSGGVLFLNGSSISISASSIRFLNNSAAQEGGAIYAKNGSFINLISVSSGISFAGNDAPSDIYLIDSTLALQTRSGASISIAKGVKSQNSNISRIESGNLQISEIFEFAGGQFNIAEGNKALFDKIPAFSYSGSSLSIKSSFLTFSGVVGSFSQNIGGAINASFSSIVFTNSKVNFNGNSNALLGGAVSLSSSYASLADSVFTANNASYGGAIYLSASVLKGVNLIFSQNNAAVYGGVIYAESGSSIDLIDPVFESNSAGLIDGGLIFLSGSKARLSASKNLTFGSGQNERYIYLSNASEIVFDSLNNSSITFWSEIYANGSGNTVRKTGEGSINVKTIKNLSGGFNNKLIIEKGSFYFDDEELDSGSLIVSGGSLFVIDRKIYGSEPPAVMRSVSANGIRIENGTVEMGAFVYIAPNASEVRINKFSDVSDSVYVDANSETKLIVNFYNANNISKMPAGQDGIVMVKYIDFLTSDVSMMGDFKWYSSPGLKGHRIKSASAQDGVYLLISPLKDISEPSHNQQEVLNLFKNIDGGLDIAIYLRNDIDDWIVVDEERAEKAISQMGGSFYSNILKLGAVNSDSRGLYQRLQKINKDSEKGDIIKSIWLQSGISAFSSDGDVLFKSNDFGLQAGFNLFAARNSIMGFYLGYKGYSLIQELDEGDLTDISLGVYGGSFDTDKNLSIKWNLGAAFESYNVKREVDLKDRSLRPESDFGANTIKGGVELELIQDLQNEFSLQPYISADAALSFNGEIKENGGDYVNLIVDKGKYFRLLGGAGLKLSKGNESAKWHIQAGLNYLAAGAKSQYDIGFATLPDRMDIWSNQEDALSYGFGAGFEMIVLDTVSLFANGDIKMNSNMNQYGVSFGINYRFAKTNRELMLEYRQKAENIEAEMTSEALLKKEMRDLEIDLLKKKIMLEEEGKEPISEDAIRAQVVEEIEARKAAEAEEAALQKQKEEAARQKQRADNLNAASVPLITDFAGSSNDGIDRSANVAFENQLARDSSSQREIMVYEPELAADEITPRQVLMDVNEDIEALDRTLVPATAEQVKQAQSRRERTSARGGSSGNMGQFTLSGSTFYSGGFELTNEAKREIAQIASDIKRRSFKKIVIEGHTDSTGDIQKNLILSHKRAREVRKELYLNGIPLNKMAYIGFGPTMPVAPNDSEAGRSRNRRVDIYVE